MSLATHVARNQRSRRALSAQTIQVSVVALGVAAVVAITAHGHDASALVGGTSVHAAIETGLMSAAMMLPVAALAVPLVMQRSLRDRRVRASWEHVVGFGLVWFAFGVAVALAVGVTTAGVALSDRALMILFVAAALSATAWQLSDRRAIIVRRCGRLRSSPPHGIRNDVGVMIAGADQASWCLRTCALSMTAMILAPHPAVMGLLWAANLSEWAPGPNPFGRARRIRPAVVLAVLATTTLAVAALG